jgi:hypothetical protein
LMSFTQSAMWRMRAVMMPVPLDNRNLLNYGFRVKLCSAAA